MTKKTAFDYRKIMSGLLNGLKLSSEISPMSSMICE